MKSNERSNQKQFCLLRSFQNKDGAVTAETALGITSIATFFVLVVFMISYVSNFLMITDASRTAARLISRGESLSVVENAVQVLAPGSYLNVFYGFKTATVEVTGPENPKIIWYLPRIKSSVETYLETIW